jgi:DNA-binding CsgD family transcriptional regulator
MEQKSLTPTQAKYLAKSARGMTYDQIAKDCVVSVKTITAALAEARKRLGTRTTLQCFAVAISREELGIDHEGYTFVPENLKKGNINA